MGLEEAGTLMSLAMCAHKQPLGRSKSEREDVSSASSASRALPSSCGQSQPSCHPYPHFQQRPNAWGAGWGVECSLGAGFLFHIHCRL